MVKPKLGSGARFKQLTSMLHGKVKDPGAVAAMAGREKYGQAKMTRLAMAGRRRAMK